MQQKHPENRKEITDAPDTYSKEFVLFLRVEETGVSPGGGGRRRGQEKPFPNPLCAPNVVSRPLTPLLL